MSSGSLNLLPTAMMSRKRIPGIEEMVHGASKAFITAWARRCSACEVVVRFLNKQVSPTQILVLPAVSLPGGNGKCGRPDSGDFPSSRSGPTGGGTCLIESSFLSNPELISSGVPFDSRMDFSYSLLDRAGLRRSLSLARRGPISRRAFSALESVTVKPSLDSNHPRSSRSYLAWRNGLESRYVNRLDWHVPLLDRRQTLGMLGMMKEMT